MQSQHSLAIYNASAGAGKTYTLVKEYLEILLSSNKKNRYKNILAITFTNKAVGEMKSRIIERLSEFANENILTNPTPLFEEISNKLHISTLELHNRASITLQALLHNYAAFEVATIDKFTHKIIRTFAKDLKLSVNFDVEMDTDFMLEQAVDQLLSKIGNDSKLSEVLLEFALSKIDDDKSWDISFDLKKIAKLLLSENDKYYLNKLKDHSHQDFEKLKKHLLNDVQKLSQTIENIATSTIDLFKSEGIQHEDFVRQSLPKLLLKLLQNEPGIKFDAKWIVEIETTKLYTSKSSSDIIDSISSLQPHISEVIQQLKQLYFQKKFLENFYQNITPISVLNALQKELDELKEEQNVLLISDFNKVISDAIVDQPTPFIYERLGEKFRHYFIDEFQDTSTLQWNNLIPLIGDVIAQESITEEKGSLTIVGDAKQSIYRWRGGNVDQFIQLFEKNIPFYLNEEQLALHQLPTNYRSFDEIIAFNNDFFSHIANNLENPYYKSIYQKGNQQKTNSKKGGYVEISMISGKGKEEERKGYTEKTFEIIKNLEAFDYSEICVLTRKKGEGIAIANFLIEKGIPIISSESLLLKNDSKVAFIIDLLQCILEPKNNEVKIRMLQFIFHYQKTQQSEHDFYAHNLNQTANYLFKHFLNLDLQDLSILSFYEKVETLCRQSRFFEKNDAYIISFLDFVFDFTLKHYADIANFLSYWEQKKEHLSIAAPENQNAVSIMTIHKSKGLEFPVVIFPFADLKIYNDLETSNWIPLHESIENFEDAYVNFSSYFEDIDEEKKQYYNAYKNAIALDHYNLLYVTLTRAVEQLYVITKNEVSKTLSYTSLFLNYLNQSSLFKHEEDYYFKGNKNRISSKEKQDKNSLTIEHLVSHPKEAHQLDIITSKGKLWETFKEEALRRGNLLHELLSHVIYEDDLIKVLETIEQRSDLNDGDIEYLKKTLALVVKEPTLNPYFKLPFTIYNEREIISKHGTILIPDRLVVHESRGIIIDYKTGVFENSHLQQLVEYGDLITEMGLFVEKKILVYINNDITLKYVD